MFWSKSWCVEAFHFAVHFCFLLYILVNVAGFVKNLVLHSYEVYCFHYKDFTAISVFSYIGGYNTPKVKRIKGPVNWSQSSSSLGAHQRIKRCEKLTNNAATATARLFWKCKSFLVPYTETERLAAGPCTREIQWNCICNAFESLYFWWHTSDEWVCMLLKSLPFAITLFMVCYWSHRYF